METTACNVLYVDRRVREDRYIDRSQVLDQIDWESSHIAENAKLLVDVFGEGMPVLSVKCCLFWIGTECLTRVACSSPVQHRRRLPHTMAQHAGYLDDRAETNSYPY